MKRKHAVSQVCNLRVLKTKEVQLEVCLRNSSQVLPFSSNTWVTDGGPLDDKFVRSGERKIKQSSQRIIKGVLDQSENESTKTFEEMSDSLYFGVMAI